MTKTYTPQELPRVLTVRVTAKDIARGISANCRRCPIALALKRDYPLHCNLQWVVEGEAWVLRDRYEMAASYALSSAADRFIRIFDTHGDVAPATFRLRREI